MSRGPDPLYEVINFYRSSLHYKPRFTRVIHNGDAKENFHFSNRGCKCWSGNKKATRNNKKRVKKTTAGISASWTTSATWIFTNQILETVDICRNIFIHYGILELWPLNIFWHCTTYIFKTKTLHQFWQSIPNWDKNKTEKSCNLGMFFSRIFGTVSEIKQETIRTFSSIFIWTNFSELIVELQFEVSYNASLK